MKTRSIITAACLILTGCAKDPHKVAATVVMPDGKTIKVDATVQISASPGGLLGAFFNVITETLKLIPLAGA
jgi:hypothetical protein